MANNNVDLAVRALQALKRDEDALVTKLGGAATRAMVRHALHVCGGDDKKAGYMLEFHKDIARNADFICDRLGLQSGLGYPTRSVIEAQLVADDNEEGNTMAAIKKQWRMEVELMADVLATAQVEGMLTHPHPHPHPNSNPHPHPLTPSPSPFTVTAHHSPSPSPSPFTVTAHHSPLTSHLSPSPSPSP